MTQSEAGKQAQPALPEVTIWPCLMAYQPAGSTRMHTHTHAHAAAVPDVPSLFVFVSQKLTCFGCERWEASGRGTSKTGISTHTRIQTHSHKHSQHMVIGHSVVVLKWC